jgi:folate-binding protein YgfZ
MTFSTSEKLFPLETTDIIIDLSSLSLLAVSGEGAKKLLQGQLTCQMEDISANQSGLGAYCNPQGRILSLFQIFFFNETYYLQMPAEILAETLKTLQKYAVFFKVKLEDASSSLQRISFCGPQAETKLKNIFAELPREISETLLLDNLLCIKLPSANAHYEFVGLPDDIKNLWRKISAHAETAKINAWKYANISAGIPSIYTQTFAKLLPHEINLPQIKGVSFTKGCYTGQEIIARMEYRGQLKKHMYRARVKADAIPEAGQPIFHEKICGTIVDSCEEAPTVYQILFIADQTDIETRQLFLDSANIHLLELLPLPTR